MTMKTITVKSKVRNELVDITAQVQKVVAQSGIDSGHCLLYVPHTTAAVTINEGADPSVKDDILTYLADQIPPLTSYKHNEGNSDSHIKSSLVGASELLIIENGKLVLGTWQSIYFCEFDGPRNRHLHIQLQKEPLP